MISNTQMEEIMLNAGLAVDLDTPIPANKTFEELGLDSLDTYNVFLELETVTGIQVPDEEIGNLQTIESIVAYVAAKGS